MPPNGSPVQIHRKTYPAIHVHIGTMAMLRLLVHSIAVRVIMRLNTYAAMIVHGSGIDSPPTSMRVPRYATSSTSDTSAATDSQAMP